MISVERYEELKRKAEQHRREADRVQGSLQQIMRELKEEFGCKSLEQANALLEKKRKALALKEKEAEKLLAKIEEEFGDEIP